MVWEYLIRVNIVSVASISIIIIPFCLPDYSMVAMVLSMIGKFGVSGGFTIIYVYTAELMPTVVRTIGVGAGSMSARVGSLLAPFIAELVGI